MTVSALLETGVFLTNAALNVITLYLAQRTLRLLKELDATEFSLLREILESRRGMKGKQSRRD